MGCDFCWAGERGKEGEEETARRSTRRVSTLKVTSNAGGPGRVRPQTRPHTTRSTGYVCVSGLAAPPLSSCQVHQPAFNISLRAA